MSEAFAALQRALPQHVLSRFVGRLATSRTPFIRDPFIHMFARAYAVNMQEAARESLQDYQCFNDFFTRELKPDARPISPDPRVVVSPADGTISQAGLIADGTLLQAKGHRYSLERLIGEPAPEFDGGAFATVYLAPSNYHRVHIPLTGTLRSARAIPGALFSVNGMTEKAIPSLFARNERLACRFDTEHGQMLIVLVGALIVASIETVWGGPQSPYPEEQTFTPAGSELTYPRGAEIGRFLVGSTVIACFERGQAALMDGLTAGSTIRMGEPIAHLA